MKKKTGKNRMGGPVKLVCSSQSVKSDDSGVILVKGCDAIAIGVKGHIGRNHRSCHYDGHWEKS